MNTTSTTDRQPFASFDDALVGELRQVVLARTAAPQRRRGRRPALAAAGIAAIVAATFGLNTLGTSAAFAVSRTDTGAIQISIHRLDDAAGLAKELASYGIDAKVDYQPTSSTPPIYVDPNAIKQVTPGDGSGTKALTGQASAGTTSGGAAPSSACGDPSNPPLTADLQGSDYLITIPKGSALTHADSQLQITTTGKIADSLAGLSVNYVIDGQQCGFGSMSASAVPAS